MRRIKQLKPALWGVALAGMLTSLTVYSVYVRRDIEQQWLAEKGADESVQVQIDYTNDAPAKGDVPRVNRPSNEQPNGEAVQKFLEQGKYSLARVYLENFSPRVVESEYGNLIDHLQRELTDVILREPSPEVGRHINELHDQLKASVNSADDRNLSCVARKWNIYGMFEEKFAPDVSLRPDQSPWLDYIRRQLKENKKRWRELLSDGDNHELEGLTREYEQYLASRNDFDRAYENGSGSLISCGQTKDIAYKKWMERTRDRIQKLRTATTYDPHEWQENPFIVSVNDDMMIVFSDKDTARLIKISENGNVRGKSIGFENGDPNTGAVSLIVKKLGYDVSPEK